MEAQVLTNPAFTGENRALGMSQDTVDANFYALMADVDPALQVTMPFQQFETLTVESFDTPETTVEALSKAVQTRNLAAEAMHRSGIEYNFNVMKMLRQAELFYHAEEKKAKRKAA